MKYLPGKDITNLYCTSVQGCNGFWLCAVPILSGGSGTWVGAAGFFISPGLLFPQLSASARTPGRRAHPWDEPDNNNPLFPR